MARSLPDSRRPLPDDRYGKCEEERQNDDINEAVRLAATNQKAAKNNAGPISAAARFVELPFTT
jgi:hypothetical protein